MPSLRSTSLDNSEVDMEIDDEDLFGSNPGSPAGPADPYVSYRMFRPTADTAWCPGYPMTESKAFIVTEANSTAQPYPIVG
jgi:hypothetical protein